MGNKASLKDKPITFFKQLNSCATIIDDRQPKTKIQLGVKLENCDKSKPYCIKGFLIDPISNSKTSLGSSEEETPTSTGLLNFQTTFILTFFFEAQQPCQFLLTQGSSGLTTTIDTTIGNIVGSRNNTFKKKLDTGETINIEAIELKQTKKILHIHFEMDHGVDYTSFKNKFYYILWNNRNLYQSELLSNEGKLNDVVIPFSLISPEFTLNFYDQYKKLVQATVFTAEKFLTKECEFISIQMKKSTLKIINKSSLKSQVTFMDYLKSGVHLSMTLGIDFTGSNGNPENQSSLHYCKGMLPNDYEKAIRYCGDILAYYDYDQQFPVYGFGAEMNSTHQTSMCFNLNMTDNPNIHTINNILMEYKKSFQFFSLSGPTNFSPIIKKTIENVTAENNQFVYNVLMILTDGMITDTRETVNAIVDCSLLPISIIIIGIGNADFSAMTMLDGDDEPLKNSAGRTCQRDIVQFVAFSKLEGDLMKLASEVLAEIPRQVVDYYRMNNIIPKIPEEKKETLPMP